MEMDSDVSPMTPDAVIAALGALAQEHRLAAFRLLVQAGEDGMPAGAIAERLGMASSSMSFHLAALAHAGGLDAVELAGAFTRLGAALGLDWAQATAARLSPSDPWERLLVGGLARDFQQMRLDALRRWNGNDPVAAIENWLAAQAEGVARFHAMIDRARKVVPTSPALLAQIAGQARGLLAR